MDKQDLTNALSTDLNSSISSMSSILTDSVPQPTSHKIVLM